MCQNPLIEVLNWFVNDYTHLLTLGILIIVTGQSFSGALIKVTTRGEKE